MWLKTKVQNWCSRKKGRVVREGKLKLCRHSSVDSSAPSTLLPRVRLPSTPSMLFSIYKKSSNCIFVAWIGMWKERKSIKRGRDWPIFNKLCETEWQTNFTLGGHSGLVVMGGDSRAEGCGFQYQHFILFWHFFILICCKIWVFCLKSRK